MLELVIAALQARTELRDWSVRHVTTEGHQLYAVPNAVEAIRVVQNERFAVEILRQNVRPDGSPSIGTADFTLLLGNDIARALEAAVQRAALVHNAPYDIPGKASLPDVPLSDPVLQQNPQHATEQLFARLRAVVATQPGIRLTAAEFFLAEQTTHICNSRGLDARQTETRFDLEAVLVGRSGDQEVESFVELRRRRLNDLDLGAEITRRARYAIDTLVAIQPPSYNGPIVLREATLATFLQSGVIQTLAHGGSKYAHLTPWEIGAPVFRSQVEGDALTLFANRQLPYGTHSNCFDGEGQPAQRVELIRHNVLTTFIANQRYADYLGIVPTGDFGNVEILPGTTAAADLLEEPHIEIVSFSWFNPNAITGEFASEIRLGYIVDGDSRVPFKGGTLVGNLMDALANVRWSEEVGFFGNYQGPTTARFGSLVVAGHG